MTRRILLLNGHPDVRPERSTAVALAAYEAGARDAGHEVHRIDVGATSFPPIVTGDEHEVAPSPDIAEAQERLTWADHVVIAFPLWLGAPPALLKSYFEQICRYDFAFTHDIRPLLGGRSARLLVTALISDEDWAAGDRLGTEGFARGVLAASGFDPIETTLVGQMYSPELGDRRGELVDLGRSGT